MNYAFSLDITLVVEGALCIKRVIRQQLLWQWSNFDMRVRCCLQMTEALWAECSKTRPTDAEETEECSVCLCPIEAGQLYRLELCAHPYCKDCFKHQVLEWEGV